MKEIWKSITGFEGLYEVSSLGKVRSLPRYVACKNNSNRFINGKILNPSVSHDGYKYVDLSNKCIKYRFKIHRLIAISFIDNPKNNPQINHKDGNKLNNNVSNLEWCTNSENQKHAHLIGIKKTPIVAISGENNPNNKPIVQISLDGRILNKFYSATEAMKITNINRGHIRSVCLGKRKTAGGYKWKEIKNDT